MKILNAKEAADKLLNEYKGYEVLGCYEYDNNTYLFSITPKGTITTSDCFYLVNKTTGEVKGYAILKDIKKFNSIINDKSKILNFK